MLRILMVGLFLTLTGSLQADYPWDKAALKAVAVAPTWGGNANEVRELYYPGVAYNGKPTRVFAYYGKPKGKGPFPAMVLVHGGGGKAFPDWVKHWTNRGYCAIAMDLSGNSPTGRLADGAPDQSDETKFKDFAMDNPREMWSYHAVADVIMAHNLIRSFPEVDPLRIGVTGISWGGYLTCIVAGVDDRFAVAVPVYGCGFLHKDSAWKQSRFDKMKPDQSNRWVNAFDPSLHVPATKCPILFLNGTNDFAYPMGSYLQTYGLVTSPKTMSMRLRLPHGHIWTFGEVDAFVDAAIKGGQPLPKMGDLKWENPTASATVTSVTPLREAKLYFAKAEGPWQNREWKSAPATIKDGRITGMLPSDRPLAFFLGVVDDRGLEVSTTHQVLEK